jgi:hypothetical protein
MLVGAAALTVGALISSAEQARNFTPVEKAACGPHWGRFCGPFHHRVCGRWRCWCAPC